MTEKQSERVPIALQGQYGAITALTDQFCEAHLNTEYRDLCRRMVAKLCRKRPSPLATGNPNTWACGVVYTAGRVNFLFDKGQTPTMTACHYPSLFSRYVCGPVSACLGDPLAASIGLDDPESGRLSH